MSNNKEELPKQILPTRRSIHSEIEEALVEKLFTIVTNIDTKPTGELNFEPYTDHTLIQLETFLEKKFSEKVFRRKEDTNIANFLDAIKKERDRREFGFP